MIRARFYRAFLALSVVVAVLACGLLGLGVAPLEPSARLTARSRWDTRGITDYLLTLRVDALGRECIQQIEVRDGQAYRMLHSSCDVSALRVMTVQGLFALDYQLMQIPASRCYPSVHVCPCQRIFQTRRVSYDQQLGFPDRMMTRSDLWPNWGHADFWKHIWEQWELPECRSTPRLMVVEVLGLVPVESRP